MFRLSLACAVQLREAFTSRRAGGGVGHRTVLRHDATEAVYCAHAAIFSSPDGAAAVESCSGLVLQQRAPAAVCNGHQ